MLILLAQLVVGAGGYATAAEAVAAARPGDTVVLRAGEHRGPLVLDRAIALIGLPGAVLDGGGRGDVIRITAAGVTVARLAIRHSGMDLNTDDAAIRIMAGDVRVDGVDIAQSLHGIYVQDAAFVTLTGNRITGDARIRESDRGNGIHLHASQHIRMERNVIDQVRDGLFFSYSDSTEAIGNRISRSRYGIHFMYARGNRFLANHFERNAGGAAIMYSWDLVAAHNTFTGHDSYRGYGIALQTTEGARVVGNRFERNTIGVFLDNAQDSKVIDNVIANNGLGLDLLSSIEGNTIARNTFAGNGVAARRTAGPDLNRWSEDGRGNFWDRAAALDLNRDGVRDLPFNQGSAFSTLASSRPALHLWRDSPAMAVLNVAERALPVFQVPAIVDSAPLTRMPEAVSPGPLPRSSRPPFGVPLFAGTAGLLGAGLLLMCAKRQG